MTAFHRRLTQLPAPNGLGRGPDRYRVLLVDVAAVEDEIAVLLARTDGQVLTSLAGVAVSRAAAFPAHSRADRPIP